MSSGDGAGSVVVVTDSTAGLTVEETTRLGITVVPLHVLIDCEDHPETPDLDPAIVTDALKRTRQVSTSRPSPATMLDCYERLAAAGAREIVSAHLSAQLSGTCDAALLAARESPVPVRVVDSRSTGLALGLAVIDGAIAAGAGRSAAQVAEIISRRCAQASVLCYVHSLEYLRRGGRIGAAAQLLGGALAIKPLLALVDGHIEPVEKLRTAGRALARLTDLAAHAVSTAGPGVQVVVHHADALARAEQLAEALAAVHPDGAASEPSSAPGAEAGAGASGSVGDGGSGGPVRIAALPAVLAVHLGPGTVAVVVAPR